MPLKVKRQTLAHRIKSCSHFPASGASRQARFNTSGLQSPHTVSDHDDLSLSDLSHALHFPNLSTVTMEVAMIDHIFAAQRRPARSILRKSNC
ncbi:hypothetical protein PGTUg99_022095 [Puccinia graminis f. sp. tritici]|uniref:Uncharacterized protein n=1 Tax=Puccinia graminis f. sp. tritici TaxID=56615 RepID=A0A5B0S565_PUCGR|nr:hypothetical protein PGTUg99_022095 [Puccinia graminis f. sp. tritici]